MRFRLLVTLPFLACAPAFSVNDHTPLDDLAIEIRGPSRPVVYTNKQTAFWYGETNARNRTSWQGFNVFGHEYLDEYRLRIDGTPLDPAAAVRTTVYPDHMVREYAGGLIEQVRPADSLAVIGVILTSPSPVTVDIVPLFSDARRATDFAIRTADGGVLLAQRGHTERTPARNYPPWLALVGLRFTAREEPTEEGSQFSPVVLAGARGKTHVFAFAVGNTPGEAEAQARAFVEDPARLFRVRRARMEHLLAETLVKTDNSRFDLALAWAKLSLDALMMNQVTRGIFAGLPWFNNYWGRDTFISLPGATLVTGRFAEAKAILRSFAAFQQTDTLSDDYGRIPNIVTTTDTAYNTADGTPRFVLMAMEYILRSGDTSFVAEVYPVVRRSIEGTIRHHTDSLGFLTHRDAETWMDAVGPDGPWSPRGNRANDIQALWAGQLLAGADLAGMVGDGDAERRWRELRRRVTANFLTLFPTDSGVVDHLNADGSADTRVRPNQIFTSHLLPTKTRIAVLTCVVERLTYEYGVASLWQEDADFHPYHQHEPYYPKDAAYHNGTVWTWVQGPVISELCLFGRQDLAFRVTLNSVDQILDQGCVGTQSELLDAIARPGIPSPALSGTVSQAWNLAEFIRNFYDDYLGVRIQRFDHTLRLRPALPADLGTVRAVVNLDGTQVPIEISGPPSARTVSIDGSSLRAGGKGTLTLLDSVGVEHEASFEIHPRTIMTLKFKSGGLTAYYSDGSTEFKPKLSRGEEPPRAISGLSLATPVLRPGIRSLKGPGYPLLSHSLIRKQNPSAPMLASGEDEPGDDTGAGPGGIPLGRFTYPRSPNFLPGSFDLLGFHASADDSTVYFILRFRTLANPGWHPEYGFQLTYAAIAIDADGEAGSGKVTVGRNSGFSLDSAHAFERVIFVGGGISIEDNRGTTLAAYLPTATDAADPFGEARTGTIRFALPLSLMPSLSAGWTFSVLAGAQDDHGGAGIGEFRTVTQDGGEWNGGGRRQGDSNIYDMIVVPSR